jgi:hypothetical protein
MRGSSTSWEWQTVVPMAGTPSEQYPQLSIDLFFNRIQTERSKADTKEMEGTDYRKNCMDAHRIYVD